MFDLIIFLSIAILGGIIGYKLGLPVGAMLGAMVFTALLKSYDLLAFESGPTLVFVLQIALGAMLGVTFVNFKKDYVMKLARGIIFVLSGLSIMIIVVSAVVFYFTELSLSIALLSSSPGAIYEMAMLANILEKDAPTVVFLHVIRVLVILSIFPIVLKYAIKWYTKYKKEEKML